MKKEMKKQQEKRSAHSAKHEELNESEREFIDIQQYISDTDLSETKDIDPMDELSDFEPENELQQNISTEQEQEQINQLIRSTSESQEESKKEMNKCVVCGMIENENEVLLCQDCTAKYHLYCVHPPLAKTPDTNWFCPDCTNQHELTQFEYQYSRIFTENFEKDTEKINELLIHACSCNDIPRCLNADFKSLCLHMKQFLQDVQRASYNEQWLLSKIANAELLTRLAPPP